MGGKHKVAVLPGDGVGPEVVKAALRVLEAIEEAAGVELEFLIGEAGINCVKKYGTNLPSHTIELVKEAEACLKGPMTTPEGAGTHVSAAVKLRKILDLYANVRPCRSMPNVPSLKPNVDLIVLRENTEGLYSGKEFEAAPGVGVAMRVVTERASRRIAKFGFKLAMGRRKRIAFVHKANILKVTDGIFKRAVLEVAKGYPQVQVEDVHVDAMAMQLIKRPESFDVIVTTNMFGDILSDEAAQLVGGLGVVPGANIGDNYAMFEPIHGSAPKYAGQNKVNPIATILASKMMMEYLGEAEAAGRMERAVLKTLEEGKVLTYDLGGSAKTSDVAEAIARKILQDGSA